MNKAIEQLQTFMKTSPIGVVYNGPVDGENNDQLKVAVNSLQNLIKKLLSNHPDSLVSSKASSYMILSGNTVVRTIDDIKSLISKTKVPAKKKSTEKKYNNIKAIQEIFNSNPFGINYSGPKDGIPNSDLIQKARELERNINKLTGADISGKITDGKIIITTAADLQKTFSIITDYQKFIKNN